MIRRSSPSEHPATNAARNSEIWSECLNMVAAGTHVLNIQWKKYSVAELILATITKLAWNNNCCLAD